jgi:lipoyl-dependent peroxiredoxin
MLTKIAYTAEVTNTGARTGACRSSDGALDVQVRQPAELGGPADTRYTNPEQLFGAAYAACFGGALAAAGKGKNMRDGSITAKVHIGNDEAGGFGLAVELHVTLPHLTPEDAKEVVAQAHKTCPYSKATKGNIDVKLVVV